MRLPHLSRFSKGGHRRPRLYVLSAQPTPGIPRKRRVSSCCNPSDTIVRSPHPSKTTKGGAAESCDDSGNEKSKGGPARPLGTNDNGNVLQVINNRNNNRTQNFTYDTLNRIASAGTSGTTGGTCWGYQYSIDAWGNLLSQGAWSPTYNGCTEGTMTVSADTQNRICALCYDPAGNMTSYSGASYSYDAEGHLTTTGGATYTYDGAGNRVKKMIGSTGIIYWRGLDGEITNETDAANAILHRHVFFAGRRVSRTDNLPTWTAHFYFSDHLGSANVVNSANGTIEDESDCLPYGGE